jgi:Ca2+-binding EF-hand superfamily protein
LKISFYLNEEKKNVATAVQVSKISYLKYNPLRRRICEVLNFNKEFVTFRDLVIGFSVFGINAPKLEKIKCNYYEITEILVAFKLFDYDDDELLSKADMKKYYYTIFQRILKRKEDVTISLEDLDEAIETVFLEMTGSRDGLITFEQFKKIVQYDEQFYKNFTMDF